jgi:alpha-beta hydrolase superfamily lysophospholipase
MIGRNDEGVAMTNRPDTVVLIHGLWMTPRSWEHWIPRYEARGFKVFAPAWPGLEVEVEALRRDPAPLANLDLRKVIDHYDEFIRRLPSAPIVMGHSTGGAVVQVLLDRGLGAAGVGISPATVKGVYRLPPSTLWATKHILGNPFNRGKATSSSEKQFRYAFGNTQTEEESRAVYERYFVPSANSVLFDLAFANVARNTPAKVDFRNDRRAPMLFIAGENDHIVPPAAAKSNVKKYAHSKALTEFKEFPGRSHFIAGEKGWEEVADYALDWAVEHAQASAPAAADASEAPPAVTAPE